MSKYEPFINYLISQPSEKSELSISFEEIERLLGTSLPPTARVDRPWWANTKASPQGSSWLSAGWLVEKVYLKGQFVVFRRKGLNPLRGIPAYVKQLLDGSPHLGQVDSRTLSNWISFCRKVGWFFEGTVLYERGGLVLDSLSEVERVEVDEDYATCKREITQYQGMRA